MQQLCSDSLCPHHVLSIHVSFTNTDCVRISYYHPSSPHRTFLNTTHLVFSPLLPPSPPVLCALKIWQLPYGKIEKRKKKKRKEKHDPSLVSLQPCLSGKVEYTSSLFTQTCLSPECISCRPHFFSLPHALTDIQRREKGVEAKMKSKCWKRRKKEYSKLKDGREDVPLHEKMNSRPKALTLEKNYGQFW